MAGVGHQQGAQQAEPLGLQGCFCTATDMGPNGAGFPSPRTLAFGVSWIAAQQVQGQLKPGGVRDHWSKAGYSPCSNGLTAQGWLAMQTSLNATLWKVGLQQHPSQAGAQHQQCHHSLLFRAAARHLQDVGQCLLHDLLSQQMLMSLDLSSRPLYPLPKSCSAGRRGPGVPAAPWLRVHLSATVPARSSLKAFKVGIRWELSAETCEETCKGLRNMHS